MSTIFRLASWVVNRSAMPEAKSVSVTVSRTENFREELPQLMTRMGWGAATFEQWLKVNGVVNPRDKHRRGESMTVSAKLQLGDAKTRIRVPICRCAFL